MIKNYDTKGLSYISNKIRTEENSISSCNRPLTQTEHLEHQ